MNIGEAIKQVRLYFDMSQAELSEKSGISQTSISQIEKGIKQPTKKSLAKISTALDVPEAVLYVMGMDEKDVPASRKDPFNALYPAMKNFVIELLGKRKTKMMQK